VDERSYGLLTLVFCLFQKAFERGLGAEDGVAMSRRGTDQDRATEKR